MEFSSNPAVLVLGYSRVDLLKQTLLAVCQQNPSKIYVSLDGANPQKPNDQEKVAAVRDLLRDFPWTCEHHVRTSETNGGVFHGVLAGIDWFFEHETSGMILEDDVLIAPGSQQFAGILLKELEPDSNVGSISLFNPVPPKSITDRQSSYRFSQLPSSQYWGTWRDRWEKSTLLRQLSIGTKQEVLMGLETIDDQRFRNYWKKMMAEYPGTTVCWEDLWIFTHWTQRWSAAYTNSNYSIHEGFNAEATNSRDRPSWYPTEFKSWDVRIKNQAPRKLAIDRTADSWYFNQRFGLSPWKHVKHSIWSRFPQSRTLLHRVLRRL